MSGDGFEFEYPDTAGYPDGMGTLHEGIDEAADEGNDEAAGGGGGDVGEGIEDANEGAATAAEHDLDGFALEDEEDVDGNV